MKRPGRRRVEVLAALRARGEPMSIKQVAAVVGIHTNTARFHLERLVQAGVARRAEPPAGVVGRPPLLFEAIDDIDADQARDYELLAGILVDYLADSPAPAERAEQAGRRWGHQGESDGLRASQRDADDVAGLITMMDRHGFAPGGAGDASTAGEPRELLLHHCPFRELARRSPEVVCSVHLGMMRGMMEAQGRPTAVLDLIPYARPGACAVHLQGASPR